MMSSREPRRVERMDWSEKQHLGALDTDVDELHTMRDGDKRFNEAQRDKLRRDHDEDFKTLNRKLDNLIRGVWGLVLVGASAVISQLLQGNL